MAHHKYKKPRQYRKGSHCTCCKPHKMTSFKGTLDAQTRQEKCALEVERLERCPRRRKRAPRKRFALRAVAGDYAPMAKRWYVTRAQRDAALEALNKKAERLKGTYHWVLYAIVRD